VQQERAMESGNTTVSQPKQSKAAERPMETGMGMGKKMMGQMGHGGGPMEMMQKMMAQMSQGDGKPAMEKMMGMCMSMCSDMMTSMRQTNALAVHATPELQQAFGEWLNGLEYQALGHLAKGAADASDVAQSLKITEDSSLYLLNRLATSGKITLTGKLKANRQE
jgi:hypothetical protein